MLRITPACAGNSPFCLSACRVNRDHPRLRGEQAKLLAGIAGVGGSPPLARGTAFAFFCFSSLSGITPACAGNSDFGIIIYPLHGDHPRLRGEQTTNTVYEQHIQGSPPLARGTGSVMDGEVRYKGITPACAGNSFCMQCIYTLARDHPRLRGEQFDIV